VRIEFLAEDHVSGSPLDQSRRPNRWPQRHDVYQLFCLTTLVTVVGPGLVGSVRTFSTVMSWAAANAVARPGTRPL